MTSRVANFFINGFGSLKIRTAEDLKTYIKAIFD